MFRIFQNPYICSFVLKLLILADLDHPHTPPTHHVHPPIMPNTPGWLEGSLGGWVGDGVGVGGFMEWVVVGWVVVGFMGGWWWGAWWGGWLESSWDGCTYSPTHEQLQCQNISFYEHPPTHQTHPKCHSVTIHILWMVHEVGGWRVHGMGGGVGG